MTPDEFYDAVTSSEGMTGQSIDTEKGELSVFVEDEFSRQEGDDPVRGHLTTLTISDIAGHTWTTLKGVIIGRIDPQQLTHMTRIVGYFSRVENWNKSKLGELRDRRSGQYGVSE